MALNSNRFDPDTIFSKIKGVYRLAVTNHRERTPDVIFETLLKGDMKLQGLMPWSSNYTFLVHLSRVIQGQNGVQPGHEMETGDTLASPAYRQSLKNKDHISLMGVYKPGDGERPLWDFPDRTLSQREFAAYLVSQVLGWPSVPPTIMRDGPHGLGSVQLFIDAEYEAHYFNMRDMPAYIEDFRQMALFDYIVNNADRKGGHCLKGKDGIIWAIDHGLTFHAEPKLRTVIWEFCEDEIPAPLLQDLARLQNLMEAPELCQILGDLISTRELTAFKKRIERLVSTGYFPAARMGRNVPFPPI